MADENPSEVLGTGDGQHGEESDYSHQDNKEPQTEFEDSEENVDGEYLENTLEDESSEGDEEEDEYNQKQIKSGDDESVNEWLGELEMENEEEEEEEEEAQQAAVEIVEEEEVVPEELPPDPSAPYNLTDSNEALKAPFVLRHDQLAEVENLWALYQDYTPAYNDLDGYITEVELIYMLKCLLLMTYTPEQLQELIDYCVKPPHPERQITFEQFVKIVTIRQRDMPIEEELRLSLQVMDPDNGGLVDREYLREVLSTKGYKLPAKLVDNFIKEVDMSNDGTIGIEDVVGTLCLDLNRDDIILLQNQINPPKEQENFEEIL